MVYYCDRMIHGTKNHWIVALSVFACAACELGTESAKWREEFGEFRKSVDAAVTNVANAVDNVSISLPGGLQQQLLLAAHDASNPAKQKWARDIAASMFNISIDEAGDFEATVTVTKANDKPLRAWAFRDSVWQRPAIEARVKSLANAGHFKPIGSVRLAPQTLAALNDDVRAKVSHSVALMAGQPLFIFHNLGAAHLVVWEIRESALHNTGMWPAILAPAHVQGNPVAVQDALRAQATERFEPKPAKRNELIDTLASAIMAPYLASQRGASSDIVVPWNVMDGDQFLFVAMPLSDWKAQEGDIEVAVVLHKKGDPSNTFRKLSAYVIPNQAFLQNDDGSPKAPLIAPEPIGPVVWAVANVAQTPLYSEEALKRMREAADMLRKWDDSAR